MGQLLVVGAGCFGSIGHRIAVLGAQAGFDIIATDIEGRSPSPIEVELGWHGLESLAEEVVTATERTCTTVYCDLTSRAQVDSLVAQAFSLGTVDGIVNASRAPIEPSAPAHLVSEDVWRNTMSVNLDGAFRLTAAFAKGLIEREQTASIVHISTIAAVNPSPGRPAYSVSKAALNMLVRVMANDLAYAGIRVNGVAPGVIATHRWDPDEQLRAATAGRTLSEERSILLRAQSRDVPLGRVGQPDDIAEATLFLLSDAASFITGETLAVSGGQVMPIAPTIAISEAKVG